MTGKESIYTVYAGHEVMYHVSTLLPHSKDNPQQLERKRHIGNDIVNIIYTDDPILLETFNPNCIKSQFTRKYRIIGVRSNSSKISFLTLRAQSSNKKACPNKASHTSYQKIVFDTRVRK